MQLNNVNYNQIHQNSKRKPQLISGLLASNSVLWTLPTMTDTSWFNPDLDINYISTIFIPLFSCIPTWVLHLLTLYFFLFVVVTSVRLLVHSTFQINFVFKLTRS